MSKSSFVPRRRAGGRLRRPSRLVAVLVAVLAVLGVAAGPAPAAGPPAGREVPVLRAPAGTAIPGRYVVGLRPGTDPVAFSRARGISASHTYTAALTGFAAALSGQQLDVLRHDPTVVVIEEDQLLHAPEPPGVRPERPVPTRGGTRGRSAVGVTAGTTQIPTVNWGLDRVDQRALPLNNAYDYSTVGEEVHAYVIDSGIDIDHPELAGRAVNVFDALGGSGDDCFGTAPSSRASSAASMSASRRRCCCAGCEFGTARGKARGRRSSPPSTGSASMPPSRA